MKNRLSKNREDYVTQKEAEQLTDYKRTKLYTIRVGGLVRWTADHTGRKILFHKDDLLKLIGLN